MTKDDARLQLNAAAIMGGFTIKRIDDGLTHYVVGGLPRVRVLFKDEGGILAFIGIGTMGSGDTPSVSVPHVAEYLRTYGEVTA